jgi:hypothetical protein
MPVILATLLPIAIYTLTKECKPSRCWWLTLVILATQEVEIRRIEV